MGLGLTPEVVCCSIFCKCVHVVILVSVNVDTNIHLMEIDFKLLVK